MNLMKPLLFLLAIPIFGIGVSQYVMSDINSALLEGGLNASIADLCTVVAPGASAEMKSICAEMKPVFLLQNASYISGLVAVLLLLSFTGFSLLAGESRKRMTAVFPPMVVISLLTLSAQVLVQGAILTYGAYLLESYALGVVHYVLIAVVGVGALGAGFSLISSIFKMTRKKTNTVLGLPLHKDEHQGTFAFVSEVAEKLGAQAPENIVVGLEPNFYVTSADVKILGSDEVLKGETLFLSMPLSRILSQDELTGVIGHELGHFRGDDTHYSMRFSPVYSGLGHAVDKMGSQTEGDRHGIAALPAHAVLSYMLETFHKNVSAISRSREFEADKAGAEVANTRAMATSLLKISLYARSWNHIQEQIVARMRQRRFTRNMSLLFSGIVKYDIDNEKLPTIVQAIGEESASHPTDSHPPTSLRIENLGLNISDISTEELMSPANSAIGLIDDFQAIEESLTHLQQKYYAAMGVEIPDEDQGSVTAWVLSAFGAQMVLADGEVVPEEIERAEAIGMHLTEDFDVIEFREFCNHPDTIPGLDKLIEFAENFDEEIKRLFLSYMIDIAEADDDVCEEEQGMIRDVKIGLNIFDK